MSNLLSIDEWDFFSIKQLISFVFKSFFLGVGDVNGENAALEQVPLRLGLRPSSLSVT